MTKRKPPAPEDHQPADDLVSARDRAREALRVGNYDLISRLLDQDAINPDEVLETLRIYQAELEIQNSELRAAQTNAEDILRRFTAFFSSVPLAELVIDRNGLILESNTEATRLFGTDPHHLRRHFLHRLVSADSRPALAGLIQSAQERDTGVTRSLGFHGAAGRDFQGELHIARLPTEPGGTAQFVCAVVDLTERLLHEAEVRAAYRQLRDSEQRYRILAEYSPDWDYWLDDDWKYRYVSPACERVCGLPPEAFVADPGLMDRLVHSDDLPIWRAHWDQMHAADAAEHPPPLEFRILRPDGGLRWIEHECRTVLDRDDRPLGRRGVHRDITARKHAEELLRLSEERFRSLFEDVDNIAVQGYDQDRRVIFWNRASQALYGFTSEEAMGRPIEDLILPEEMREAVQSLTPEKIAAGAPIPQGELQLRRKDGSRATVFSNSVLRTNSAGELEIFSLDVDLTRLKEAEDQIAQAAKAFDSASEGILIADADGRIQFVNRAFTEITGYSEAEILGQNPRILQSGRQDEAFYRAMWDQLNDTGRWQGEIWNRRKNGEVYPEWLTITAVARASGSIYRYVAVFSDITQLRRSEQERDFLANHDPLTGLPNRLLLRDRLEHALERAERHGSTVAVLFMDLDRFKNVNEGLGHAAGDQLLHSAAKRIMNVLRSDDTLARPGGDEFVIVLESDPTLTGTTRVATRVNQAMAAPFELGPKPVFIGASIGVSWFPADGTSVDTLLKNAELAMYQAKAEGGHAVRFFRAQEAAGVLDRIQLESDLRTALEESQLLLHYQPQVELASGRLIGVEALLRWVHPERGMIPPAVFIPVAEECGLIEAIGDWVLMKACQQMTVWHNQGLAIPRMAVNLSVQQLEREILPHRVGEVLKACTLPAAELELEVTESMIMRRAERAIATLNELRDLGVVIAVDDFGTGYSSLAYLRRLPLHRLKIDRGFVNDIGVDAEGEAITRAIIGLGKSLGLEILAEGVETPEQAEFLEREGCQLGQGYLFSRPVPPEEITRDWSNRIASGTNGKR